ncbi:MAG: phospholipase A [Nevskiaceae bacterium]
MKSLAASVLFFLASATAQAQVAAGTPPAEDKAGRIGDPVDPEAYAILSAARGLNTHRPMYLYPATYSAEFHGRQTELVGQLSGKWRVFGSDFFLAYTQRSFWQYLNGAESSPFRETNYDPEAFFRWELDPKRFNRWAVDIGIEHESNGQRFPDSRSWNRIYLAPFQAKGRHLAYLKFWYRVPEGDPSSPTNQNGDDNPDITDYMGYGELTFSRQIGNEQLLTGMVRGNPATGYGAVQVTWSVPSDGGWVFWGVSVFHGYGESLSFYDQEVTRFMVGVMLAR